MSDNFICYLCKNNISSVIADKEQIRFACYDFDKKVIKCLRCGLVQLYPPWEEEELADLYSRYSKKSDFKGAKHKRTITSYLPRFLRKSDSILEVGCGSGDNLSRLMKKGYHAIGIDKDPTVCNGEQIMNYDYRDFTPPNGKFDFIYAIQVIEHTLDPKGFIAWIINNLKPKGRFLLEIPNIDDPLLKLYRIKKFNDYYWYPYHLFFFNMGSIRFMFDKITNTNIKIKLWQRYGLINHLRWLIFKRPGNINNSVPILDDIYKLILTKLLKKSDTLIVVGEKL